MKLLKKINKLNSMKAQKTDEPIIVITEDGFKYKGELIEDKGEVYKLFKNYLTSSQTEISDEEIAIKFADWIVEQKWDKVMVQGYNDDGTLICKTTKELFKIFLNGIKNKLD